MPVRTLFATAALILAFQAAPALRRNTYAAPASPHNTNLRDLRLTGGIPKGAKL